MDSGLFGTASERLAAAAESTAFVRTLAGVLFAAGGHATLQADALTTAAGGQGHAGRGRQGFGEFAIGFGNDFVAHNWLLRKKSKPVLGHKNDSALPSHPNQYRIW
jgi:hypothetical protein